MVQGLLVAHELKEKLCPQWLAASDAPSSNKVLEVRNEPLYVSTVSDQERRGSLNQPTSTHDVRQEVSC